MSDTWSRVGVFGQSRPISLEQPDLRETDTFVYPEWMLCFSHFAGLGHQLHNIALAVSSSPFYPSFWERFWHQSDVGGWCHVVFLTARFKDHFWGQNGSTLKACKIVTFNARGLKLWSRVFDKVNCKTKQKQISLHRYFKVKIKNVLKDSDKENHCVEIHNCWLTITDREFSFSRSSQKKMNIFALFKLCFDLIKNLMQLLGLGNALVKW